jgi:glycosyltransferase involved in cell wall biosynthesis
VTSPALARRPEVVERRASGPTAVPALRPRPRVEPRRPLKVLQFITRLDLGGAQEICLDLCRRLIERGDEVHLLTGSGGELMEAARRMPGLELHPWDDWRHPIRPGADLRCALRLAAMLRDGGFDVLHTHSSKAGLVGRLTAWLVGRPSRVIHHVHGWSFNESQAPWVRRGFVALERLAARPGFLLLSCGRRTDAQGREHGVGRDADRRVAVNGIDRSPHLRRRPRHALRRRLGLARGDVLFLQLGNLKPQKDPLTFARAALQAGAAQRRGRFWIAGEGPLRDEVESLVREAGMADRVRVLGWRTDVPELLAVADVMVLSSRFEGLPMAVLRGMAAGLPVVATAVDGTVEAIEHGRTGFLVPREDPVALAEALLRLGRSPNLRLRMGVAGRIRSARFASHEAARAALALYAEGA